MNVSGWETPATFFPWPHVQRYIDQIDAQVYRVSIKFAKEIHGSGARSCPTCGRPSGELFWFSITSPEEDWDAGTGRVGFLTLCERCELQVDFLVDQDLTDMQTQQWRDIRALF